MTAVTDQSIPQLSRSDERFAAFAKHFVRQHGHSVKPLLALIEKPEDYQAEFVSFLCGVNTDQWRPDDVWETFLERNVHWRESADLSLEIDPPQLVVDLTEVPEEMHPAPGERVSFSVRAKDSTRCPDFFGWWCMTAVAYPEPRMGRPCVVWEVEQSI